MTVQIDVELNEQWRDDITELKTEFQSLDGERVDLEANVDDAIDDVGRLQTEIETLTGKTHEIDVETNIDHDSIQKSVENLNDIKVDDVNLDLGDLSDGDNSVKITSEIDDDDPLMEMLKGDGELTQKGVVRWSSTGGYAPTSSGGTVHWDADVDKTDLIQELKEARAAADAAGATTIEYEVEAKDGSAKQFLNNFDAGSNGKTSRTHRYTEYTRYEGQVNRNSFKSAKEDLARLKNDIKNSGLAKIESEVCVKRCDDWKKNLNNIYKDLDALKKWEDDNGDIRISLQGNLNEIEDTLDRLEDDGFEPTSANNGGSSGDTDIERMARNADSGSQWDMVKAHTGITDDEGGGGRNMDGPGWQKDDRRWMMSGMSNSLVTETPGQTNRLEDILESQGLSADTSGDRFNADDLEITTEMETEVIRDIYGDEVADSPSANFHRPDADKVARNRKYANVVREYDKPQKSGYKGRDYSDHGEFGIPDTYTKPNRGGYNMQHVEQSGLEKDLTAGEIRERAKDIDDPVKRRVPGESDGFEKVYETDRVEDYIMRESDGEAPTNLLNRVKEADDDVTVGEIAQRADSEEVDHPGFENILDKEHGTNPFTEKERNLMNKFGVDMKDTGFMDSDDDSGMAGWFRSVTKRRSGDGGFGDLGGNIGRFKKGGGSSDWGDILGFGGLPGFGGDGDGGAGGGPGGGALKKLMPTMAKYWQLIALLSPMLITLAANAAGVAAAMGSVAVAGGAVMGLGLLGFGDSLGESMQIAQKKLKNFKKELYQTFQGTFNEFSKFTEAFLITAPVRMEPLADSMSGLTEFVPSFNKAFDGAIGWVSELINTMVEFEPILSQLALRFGGVIGDKAIKAFKWLTMEASRNQDVMMAVGGAIFNLVSILYQVAKVMTYLVAIFAPLISLFQYIASFFDERFIAAFLAGIGVVYGMITAIGLLTGAFGTLLSVSLSSMAASIASFAATAITSFLAAAEALAVLIAGEATLLAMTGAGLALVAAGIAAGYMAYSAIAPSGASSSLGGGGGAAPGVGGGGMGGGGGGMGSPAGAGSSKTVINVQGDISKATIGDVEDAVSKQYSSETTIEEGRDEE